MSFRLWRILACICANFSYQHLVHNYDLLHGFWYAFSFKHFVNWDNFARFEIFLMRVDLYCEPSPFLVDKSFFTYSDSRDLNNVNCHHDATNRSVKSWFWMCVNLKMDFRIWIVKRRVANPLNNTLIKVSKMKSFINYEFQCLRFHPIPNKIMLLKTRWFPRESSLPAELRSCLAVYYGGWFPSTNEFFISLTALKKFGYQANNTVSIWMKRLAYVWCSQIV